MDEDEGGFGDVADSAGAGGDVLEGAPPPGEQREPAFAEAAQGPQQHVVGLVVDVQVPAVGGLLTGVNTPRPAPSQPPSASGGRCLAAA